MHVKACARCGGFHPVGTRCTKGREYKGGVERSLRKKYSWTKKSLEIREKANYLCEVCRDNNLFVYDGLEVHHIHKLKDNQDRLLDDLNLICLCVECHKKADAGDIPVEYLEQLAWDREHGRNIPGGV